MELYLTNSQPVLLPAATIVRLRTRRNWQAATLSKGSRSAFAITLVLASRNAFAANPDGAAWQTASGAANRTAYAQYRKSFPERSSRTSPKHAAVAPASSD